MRTTTKSSEQFSFKNEPSIQVRLGLIGKRKQSIFGWIEQALQFYNSDLASKEIIRKLSRFNITREKLKPSMTGLKVLNDANAVSH